MGKRLIEQYHHRLRAPKSQTLPPSPSHSFSSSSSSSSSDFEFTVSVSPRKSSNTQCPADELFYKGQLLPLHLSPRLSMVRTLLLASSSTSSSSDAATSTTASRDSTGSSTDSHSSFNSELVLLAESCDSSRRASSVAEDDEYKRLAQPRGVGSHFHFGHINNTPGSSRGNKYFSLARFSSVFKKEPNRHQQNQLQDGDACTDATVQAPPSSSVRRISVTAKEVIRKYLKKVKPLYEKISQKQQQQQQHQQHTQKLGRLLTVPASATSSSTTTKIKSVTSILSTRADRSVKGTKKTVSVVSNGGGHRGGFSNSFSGNLRYPRRKSSISSCPSSIRSSPSHSGVLCRPGFSGANKGIHSNNNSFENNTTSSSMDELQSAIQGAIAHCKNSLLSHQTNNKSLVSNEI